MGPNHYQLIQILNNLLTLKMETISAKSGSGSRQEWLREEQYLKCKDIHRALEINIPEFDELIKTQKANAQPIFVYSAKDSATAEAQKSNKSTSRSLSSKYQTANSAKTLPAVVKLTNLAPLLIVEIV